MPTVSESMPVTLMSENGPINHSIIVTCPLGFEALTQQETQAADLACTSVRKGVLHCAGTIKSIYRYCITTRLANRIFLPISSFVFNTLDELASASRAVEWEKWFDVDSTFAIEQSVIDLQLDGVNDPRILSLKVKDGLVDRFMDITKKRPSVDNKSPDFPIRLLLEKNQATLSLDLAGGSLHQRGYRVRQTEAPIKENLAAGLYQLHQFYPAPVDAEQENSGLNEQSSGVSRAPTCIVDPMCGSGTLLIESAYALMNIAPGLTRDHFGFFSWLGHQPQVWQEVLDQEVAHKQAALQSTQWPKIIGYDADSKAIQAAKINIEQAGLADHIHIERKELFQFFQQAQKVKKSKGDGLGLLIVNPPYGERIDEVNSAAYLYQYLGRLIRDELSDWSVVCIANQIEYLDQMGLETRLQIQLFNGPIKCVARSMQVTQKRESAGVSNASSAEPKSLVEGKSLSDKTVEGAESFCNRLRKNWRGIKAWVRDENIQCFRLYDADIPEFNVAVDIFPHGCHVQEYAPPKTVDASKAQKRLAVVVESLVKVLDMPKRDIHLKVRSKQKGKNQYTKVASQKKLIAVQEGNAQLLVNLTDYLDTGLFLDHRPIRQRIGQESKGLRVLNLFAYTGAATVHAAVGGAKQSVSVDLSTTYCQWAQANLANNGFSSVNHPVIKSDVKRWLQDAPQQFDLIFMDPPTFSNSKSTHQHFDVQADHVEYIELAMRRLEPGGVLYFSTNFRRFQIANEALAVYSLSDISAATIPKDYSRNTKVHQVWRIQHTDQSIGRQATQVRESQNWPGRSRGANTKNRNTAPTNTGPKKPYGARRDSRDERDRGGSANGREAAKITARDIWKKE